MDVDKDKILENYYFKVSNPAAFTGAQKLHRVLNKKYPNLFSLQYIKKWLNNQDSYSLQRQVRHRFKTPKVLVSGIDDQFEADLASVANLAKENNGIHYLLFVIDVFSKYLWIKPLKNKTAKSVLDAMKNIFQERKPMKLRTDKGSEFVNQWFKKFMKDNHVYFFTSNNVSKASVVERCQRSVKGMLFRMMRQKRNYRYIDDLNKLVDNYNATPHRSLNYLAPKDVNKGNEADVWAHMYLQKSKSERRKKSKRKYKPPIKFKKGQLVRISFQRKPFVKSYMEQFSTEVFKVVSVRLKQGIPMYKLEDLKGETIKGFFYNSELSAVDKDESSLFLSRKF